MLVVIAIVGALLLSAVSIFGGSGPQARKSANDLLYAMIDQARTAAITSRSEVILAIAEPGDLPTGDQKCRLGLFKVEKWPDGSSDVTATLLSRWKTMETGVALLPGEVKVSGEVNGVPNPLDGDELTITYGNNRSVRVHALAFSPRGRLSFPEGSSPVALRLAEGTYRNGSPIAYQATGEGKITENRIKIGRVSARPYRFDG